MLILVILLGEKDDLDHQVKLMVDFKTRKAGHPLTTKQVLEYAEQEKKEDAFEGEQASKLVLVPVRDVWVQTKVVVAVKRISFTLTRRPLILDHRVKGCAFGCITSEESLIPLC